jgi:hypothetical protein
MPGTATKIKRSQLATFMNTGTSGSPVWKRIGKGVTGQTIGYNPQTNTETDIDQDSATTNLDGYQVNIPTPQTAYAGDPVFDFVDNLRRTRAIGSDAEVEILIIYLYTGSPYKAERNQAVIQIDDFGGDGGSSVVLNYTLNLNGDPVIGTAIVADGTPVFTPTGITELALSSIVPAANATAVAVGASIVLTFSNAIKGESVVVTTAAGVAVAVSRAWNAVRTVLTLQPTANMSASTVHLVAITGVVDVYGQTLATSVSKFTTV